MPESVYTSLARLRSILLRYGESIGLDRHEALRQARLTEHDLDNPDERLPLDSSIRLWKYFIERQPDEAVGLRVSQTVSAREYGLVGYAMYFSHDLRAALRRLVRYCHIVSDALQCSMKEGPSRTALVVQSSSPPLNALRHPVDARLAGIVQVAREITNTRIVPEEVWFSYPRPQNVEEHRAFFGSELVFGKREPGIVFKTADLERAVVAADETLGGYLDELASDVLLSLAHEGSFRDALARVLLQLLSGGQPSLQKAAKVLGLSPRTIQRRLKEEKTSFSQVLEHLRHKMALQMIQERDHSIGEIAFFLGYSETSAFHRAFRRWTGKSPQEYRRGRGDAMSASS